FAPQVRMSDPAPLTQPPALPPAPGMEAPPVAANLGTALAMILLACGVLVAGLRLDRRLPRILPRKSADATATLSD
ncbi:MAG TPA: hypothetical protein PL187_09165, partial [Caldilinea sp.]|nr:hypothetical protein [Caldilinea sp.]